MAVSAQGDEKREPRTWYYKGGGVWEGDADFEAWQRRKHSLNRWDALAVLFFIAALSFGAMLWVTTGNVVIANLAFWSLLALAIAMAVRKWFWSHSGH